MNLVTLNCVWSIWNLGCGWLLVKQRYPITKPWNPFWKKCIKMGFAWCHWVASRDFSSRTRVMLSRSLQVAGATTTATTETPMARRRPTHTSTPFIHAFFSTFVLSPPENRKNQLSPHPNRLTHTSKRWARERAKRVPVLPLGNNKKLERITLLLPLRNRCALYKRCAFESRTSVPQ